MFGVDGLITLVVALHGLAMQVGRKGDDPGTVDNLGKAKPAIPVEIDNPGVAYSLATGSRERYFMAVDVEFA